MTQRLEGLPSYPLAGIPEARERLRSEGRDVIDLGAGDSGLPVPAPARKALAEAVDRPELQSYAFQSGLPELREAIADFMGERYGTRPDPETEIALLVGSKEGLAHLAFAALDPGDTALLPDPGYAPYLGGSYFADARPHRVPLRAANDFLVPPDAIREAPGRLGLVYLNYPNNPTAAVAELSYLQEIVEAVTERGAVLAWDNAYAEVAFDGYRPAGLLQIEGGMEAGLEFHSFSKSFNMTGWRLAWAVGSARRIGDLTGVKSFFDTGPYLGIQAAGAALLRDAKPHLEANLRALAARRDAAVEAFRSVGFDVPSPKATLYLWAPVPTGEPSLDFVRRVLEEEAVVLLPGAALGEAGEGFVRIALTVEPDRYREAARRIARQL